MQQDQSSYSARHHSYVRYLERHPDYKGKIGKIQVVRLPHFPKVQPTGINDGLAFIFTIKHMGIPKREYGMQQEPG